MDIFLLLCAQIIFLLILARVIQENSQKMKEQNIDCFRIKEINQRTIIIFLLSEILIIIVLCNFENLLNIINYTFCRLLQ